MGGRGLYGTVNKEFKEYKEYKEFQNGHRQKTRCADDMDTV
jgi:hypothetical protein